MEFIYSITELGNGAYLAVDSLYGLSALQKTREQAIEKLVEVVSNHKEAMLIRLF